MKFKRAIVHGFAALALSLSTSLGQQYQPTNGPVSTASYDQSETTISVDPNNSNHLMAAWNDFRSNVYSQPGYAFTTDGGNTWSLSTPLDPVPDVYDFGVDPSCAFDRIGNEYYTYIATNSAASIGTIYISRSSDNGASWVTNQVSTGLTNEDKPFMAVDNTGGTYNGRLYVAWTHSPGASPSVKMAYSNDQGSTWSSAYTIQSLSTSPGSAAQYSAVKVTQNPGAVQAAGLQFATPAVGPDGTLYVVYLYASGGTGSPGTIRMIKSSDGGSTFNSPTDVAGTTVIFGWNIVGALRVSTIPTIAVDPSSGNLYVAYTQYDNGDYNIYWTRSTNGGTSWGTPAIATQSSSGLQFQPWLTASPSGTLSLTYYQGTSTAVDVYEAESYDNGLTFYNQNTKVTSSSGNPSNGTWTCDYIGSAAIANRSVWPVWSDFRSSAADVYSGQYNSPTRLAYLNVSFDNSATTDNNNRVVAHGYGGSKLYETFSSGGEIFFRRSPTNGSSWDVTTRLSVGDGGNQKPCIAVQRATSTSDTLHVVWERYITASTWDIYYCSSFNSGTTWNTPVKLQSAMAVTADQAEGPQPVITGMSYLSGGGASPAAGGQPLAPSSYTSRVLVVFASSTGLKYTWSDNPYNFWSPPSGITSSSPTTVWHPSLANSGTDGLAAYLTYDARYDHKIYARSYDASQDLWSSEAVAYDGSGASSFDRYSCIGIGYLNYPLYVAWNSYDNGSATWQIKMRSGLDYNNWGQWSWSYTDGTNNQFYPSITGYNGSGTSKIAITNYTNPATQAWIHTAVEGSATWDNELLASDALGAVLPGENNATGFVVPTEFWTGSQSATIRTVAISQQYLPKTGAPVASANSTAPVTGGQILQRALVFDSWRLEFGNVQLVKSDGQVTYLPLRDYDYTKGVDTTNLLSYLQTSVPASLAGVDHVTFSLRFSTDAGSLANDTIASPKTFHQTSFAVSVGNRSGSAYQLASDSLKNVNVTVRVPASALSDAAFVPEIAFPRLGPGKLPGKFLCVENMINANTSVQQTPIAQVQSIGANLSLANFPNPFNPSTKISFTVPATGRVLLTVFDLIGRRVSTLVDETVEAGTHEVPFDASRLASGMYFYRIQFQGKSIVQKMLVLK